jgi:hypothetical protein
MESQTQTAAVHPTFFRAFLPFWITFSASALIFCIEYHRHHAPLNFLQVRVSVAGQQPEEGFTITANGRPIDLEKPVSLGPKEIVISTPYTQSRHLKHFVWYGPNQLGSLDLERAPVSFRLEVHPTPDRIELHSSFGTNAGPEVTFLDEACVNTSPSGAELDGIVAWPSTVDEAARAFE